MVSTELRERTRQHHQRLEAVVEVMNPGLTRSHYLQLLKSFYGFYQPAELALHARPEWAALEPEFGRRRKVPLLHRDFKALGLSDPEIAQLPLCAVIAPIESFEDALGCAYVLEGATLGGQLISRHLNSLFAMDEGTGCAFFLSYAGEVLPMWRSFIKTLNEHPCSEQQQERIILSACTTFDSLYDFITLQAQ
jgi:heme oxygenase